MMPVDDAFARSARAGHRLDLLLLAAAREHGDRVALTIGDVCLSYRDLFERAEILAGELVSLGARPETFIGVAADRSVDAVVAMIGTVLTGAAYLPLDTQAPRERLRETVRRAGVRLVAGPIPPGFAEDLGVPLPTTTPRAARATGTPDDAVYAIFTSGSTGKPKGVVVPHRAVVNSTTARFAVFPWRSMTYLMLAPLTFNAAVAGLYFTLAAGGHLIVPTAEESVDPAFVADLVVRHGVTHLDGVPSQYAAILEFHADALAELECVVVGGEPLAQGLVRQHAAALPEVPLFNEYGPTESTVWSTCHVCDPADEGPFAPVGVPIAGVDVEVLGEDLEPVDPGEIGEIVISGRQLARGYLGQPGLTAARFVAHPGKPGQRRYLTGDRGRIDRNGRLVHCGRTDSMVKVRGFRVEVTEVEGWLRAQPDVVDAVVVPEPFAGTTRLVALVLRSNQSGPAAQPLRVRLAEHLPSYMIPAVWREIPRIPLTANGKIDRAAAAKLITRGEVVPEPTIDDLQAVAHSTLTRIEWAGLMTEHNLADGHARQDTPPGVDELIERLPSLYRSVEARLQLDVQQDFERTFFRMAGQPSVLDRDRPPQHHYSSSLSIEVVANHLRAEGMRVGLLHPTFDNIPGILLRHGVPLVPVSERIFATPEDPACWGEFDALFLVTPNNPTGLDPSPRTLERIGMECRRRGILLIVDFSFRFFSDRLDTSDTYAFFEENDIDHVGIEDVGKVWPLLDLKVGSIISGRQRNAALQSITDDLLLNVSPFVFALLAESGLADVIGHARKVSVVNRAALTTALSGGPLSIMDAGPTMSVAWIRLPEAWDAGDLVAWLAARDIVVLPGMPFFWADPSQGSRFVRVALMRPAESFATSAAALAGAVSEYRSGDSNGGR
jgi:amino acid adenylation domain-containing protein